MARYIDLDKVNEYKNSYCNTTSVTHCNRDCAECFYSNGGAEDVALERLTPLPPYKKEFATVVIHYCPRCGEDLELHPNFCYNCGQAIEWE